MAREYELYKCRTLVRWLIRHHQPTERALEIYPKTIYQEVINDEQESPRIF